MRRGLRRRKVLGVRPQHTVTWLTFQYRMRPIHRESKTFQAEQGPGVLCADRPAKPNLFGSFHK